jgi:hypothetical protein
VAELEGNVETVWMHGSFLKCRCQRFKQKGLLSQYCDTGLLKQTFANSDFFLNFLFYFILFFFILKHNTFRWELYDKEPLLELWDGRFDSPN